MARRNRGAYKGGGPNVAVAIGVMFILLAAASTAFVLYQDAQYKALFKGAGDAYTMPVTALLFMFAYLAGLGLLFTVLGLRSCKKLRDVSEKMRNLTASGAPARDFLAARNALRQNDFTGVYVLHNKTKGMYYVGQSVRVIDRAGRHLTGHGNGDVYADFKYGDEFEVSTVSLAESGYGSLNDLERDTIAAYDAYKSGYNRTPGNAR